MTIEHPCWETIAVTHRDGITELRVHTDGGPLVWSATAHHELTEAFYWLGNQQQTKVAILTGQVRAGPLTRGGVAPVICRCTSRTTPADGQSSRFTLIICRD